MLCALIHRNTMLNPHLIKNLTWEKADELIAAHTEEVVSPELCPDPLVSVLVLTYQHAHFIRECMDGILMQKTTFPFEIVVGDDGSTDGAYEILLDYQKKHPDKIRLFHSVPNLGRYTGNGNLNATRNLQACRGKYCAFIEGDDYWTSQHKLRRQVDLLESNPRISGSFHDVEIVGNWNGEQIFSDFGEKTEITFQDQLTFDVPMQFGSMIWRREITANLPEWHLNFPVGDVFFIAWLTSKGPMVRIPEKMGAYRRHSGGMTLNGSLVNFGNCIKMLKMFQKLREYFHDYSDNEYYNHRIRYMIRILFKRSRRPTWKFQYFLISLKELLCLPLPEIQLLIKEHFGKYNKSQSKLISYDK